MDIAISVEMIESRNMQYVEEKSDLVTAKIHPMPYNGDNVEKNMLNLVDIGGTHSIEENMPITDKNIQYAHENKQQTNEIILGLEEIMKGTEEIIDDVGDGQGTHKNIQGLDEKTWWADETKLVTYRSLPGTDESIQGANGNMHVTDKHMLIRYKDFPNTDQNMQGSNENIVLRNNQETDENLQGTVKNMLFTYENMQGSDEKMNGADKNMHSYNWSIDCTALDCTELLTLLGREGVKTLHVGNMKSKQKIMQNTNF